VTPLAREDLTRLGAVAEAAARLGGRVVAEHFGRLAAGVYSKAPGDYVSEVDLQSEETVREALARDAPGIAFFGEEGGGTRGDVWWVVDPLDGTANFLHGFPIVGVSVALVEAGRPVVGAVHAPLLGETYTAVRGDGAFRDGRPVRVAERPPASAICTTGFPFKRKDRLDAYRRVFEGAFLGLEDLRRAGAASLDLAWTAAGALLVAEAGGVVTDWAGDEEAWLASGDILAAPAPVHNVLLDLARGA